MRIDLTVCGPDGVDRDVAVLAGGPVPFGQVAPALRAALGAAAAPNRWYSGTRPLADTDLVGGPRLRPGAWLASRPQADPPAARRAEVVGGIDAGATVSVGRQPVIVGRGQACDLVLRDPDVSRRHLELRSAAAGVHVRDLGSTHGARLEAAPLTGPTAWHPGDWLRIGDTHLALAGTRGGPVPLRSTGDGRLAVRPRRRTDAAPPAVVSVPAPPSPLRRSATGWSTLLVPSAAGIGLAVWTGSLAFLALALLSPVLLGGALIAERVRGRRGTRRRTADALASAARAGAELAAALRAETASRRHAFPDAAAVLAIAEGPLERIWERECGAPDLLRVRVGLADLPAATQVDTGGRRESAGAVRAVPVVVELSDGPLGIVGPSDPVHGVARWLVAQLAVLGSPAAVQLEVRCDDDAAWRWARWLPHVQPVGGDAVRVVIVDAADPAPVRGPAICLAGDRGALPHGCAHVLTVANEAGTRLVLDGLEVLTDAVDLGWAEQVARALAPLAPPRSATARAVPVQCRLADVLGPIDPTAIADRWSRSRGGAAVPIGIGPDGPLTLDLDRHGPHALVAGTTGAGKSQLLRTWVATLAGAHPPEEIAFVLVDYKGGSAFAECAALPHTVGMVTDLDEHLTVRALASLGAELRRRERLLAAAGVADLAAYRARGAGPPLARLMIVVDEFATLATELPDFVHGLTNVARRGRSLGLHLVLATQRPAGVVTAEVRANCSLRIALRVTDPGDSQDVVDGPQAAALPQDLPGRAYVWTDGASVPVQVARSDLPPRGSRGEHIEVRLLGPWRALPPPSGAEAAGGTELAALVDAVALAGIDRPRVAAPWLPPLPDQVRPDDLPVPDRPGTVVLGLVDLPSRQARRPLILDLRSGCSVLVAGAPRTGRTAALVMTALAAARQLAPDELHLHVIDARRDLGPTLSGLPHAGTVVGPGDGLELADALLAELERPSEAAQLLLVDGWEELARASDEADGGRLLDRILALVRSGGAGRTVVIAGDRGALAPRLASAVTTRLLLRLPDRSDHALAGIPLAAVPSGMPPGRALLAPDGFEVQLAHVGAPLAVAATVRSCAERWAQPPTALRLRPLPRRVDATDLPAPGELAAEAIVPFAVAAPHGHAIGLPLGRPIRLLVAGPARSGRSTALRTLLGQALRAGLAVSVAAPLRSALRSAASELGVRTVDPDDDASVLADLDGVLLVDDSEDFADAPLDDALVRWSRAAPHALVVAGRTDDVARAYRGLAAEIRRSRCALLLQPGALDGELLGVRLGRGYLGGPPGRGVLAGDPAWGDDFADGLVRVQVAVAA